MTKQNDKSKRHRRIFFQRKRSPSSGLYRFWTFFNRFTYVYTHGRKQGTAKNPTDNKYSSIYSRSQPSVGDTSQLYNTLTR